MKKLLAGLAAMIVFFYATNSEARPTNIIIYMGDGLGFEQVKAARLYLGHALPFEMFPYQGEIQTFSADSSVTDSAASATAIATGVKVNNGVVSVEFPGGGAEMLTLLEEAMAKGKKAGLVTTSYLTHATPAAFGAHEISRYNLNEIADDYLTQTLPNVLFGGGGHGLTEADTQSAGYEVAFDAVGFAALDPQKEYLSAQFGTDHMPYKYPFLGSVYPFPSLAEMTKKALDALDDDPNGLFLLVEGGRIDHACHINSIERAVHETLDFSEAVQIGMDWAMGRSDTLIIVTADHETGGLLVETGGGELNYPIVSWSTTGHTGVNVPIYAWGANARYFNSEMDNTEVFRRCLEDDIQPTVSFKSADQSVAENVGSISITLELSGLSSLDVHVPFIAGGTATGEGLDYGIRASPITIPAGKTSADIIVTPTNDTLLEGDETVIVTMGTPINALKGAATVHTVTIYDNGGMAGCPDCSGVNPVVRSVVFKPGTDCTCTGTDSITIGPGVVVESKARAVFVSKKILVKSKVEVKEGAVVKMGQ